MGAVGRLTAWWESIPAVQRYFATFAIWMLIFRWTGCDKVFVIFSIVAFTFGPSLGRRLSDRDAPASSVFDEVYRQLPGEARADPIQADRRVGLQARQRSDDNSDMLSSDEEDAEGPPTIRS